MCVFAQVGQCLKDLIGGSKGLPYLKNERYNFRPPPNMTRNELEDKLAEQESENKKDLLYRKCSWFPFVKKCLVPNF